MNRSVEHASVFPFRWWWSWVVVGVALRVAAIGATPVFPLVANTWDSTFYHEAAESLANGEGYRFDGQPTALFPPGYPVVLSAFYRVFDADPRVGQFVNLGASLGIWAAAGWLAGLLLGPGARRMTWLVLAVEPSQILMPAFLMSETLCAFWIVTGLAAMAAWRGSARWIWWCVAIVAWTAAGWTRGHAFLVPPVLLAIWWWREPVARLRVVWLAIGLLVVQGATLAAWSERNQQELGSRVWVATNGGLNLLLGNNPDAWGGRADPPGGMPVTGDEVVDERIARERAWRFVREHPVRTLLLVPVKAVRLLGPAPATTYRAEVARKWGVWAGRAAVLAAALAQAAAWVALLWGIRRRPPAAVWWLLLVLGVWTLGHLPFLGGARYFFPVAAIFWVAVLGARARFSLTPVSGRS